MTKDVQTDGRYQVHYLVALLRYTVDKHKKTNILSFEKVLEC